MEKKIKSARIQLGGYFAERRKKMERSQQEIGEIVGVTANTINGVEKGRFAADIDLIFKICQALEMKLFFVPVEGEKNFFTNYSLKDDKN